MEKNIKKRKEKSVYMYDITETDFSFFRFSSSFSAARRRRRRRCRFQLCVLVRERKAGKIVFEGGAIIWCVCCCCFLRTPVVSSYQKPRIVRHKNLYKNIHTFTYTPKYRFLCFFPVSLFFRCCSPFPLNTKIVNVVLSICVLYMCITISFNSFDIFFSAVKCVFVCTYDTNTPSLAHRAARRAIPKYQKLKKNTKNTQKTFYELHTFIFWHFSCFFLLLLLYSSRRRMCGRARARVLYPINKS